MCICLKMLCIISFHQVHQSHTFLRTTMKDCGWNLSKCEKHIFASSQRRPLRLGSLKFVSVCPPVLKTELSCIAPFHLGQRQSPSGVSHQKEAGFSSEGGSDRGQGGHRQLQHPSSAPSHAPGPSEEPAPGTLRSTQPAPKATRGGFREPRWWRRNP